MIEVHVVAPNNRRLYTAELDTFFEWRHRIYVEEKHWHEPYPDRRERDQFDTDAATYLIGFDNGELVSGSRLIPTDQPYLVRDVFPHMAGRRGLPGSPDIAEWTRMFVVPSRREKAHSGVSGQMCCAVMEYALQEGMRQIGGLQEIYWLPRWQDYDWRVEVLGEPEEIDGMWCVAAFFDVSEAALAGAWRACGVERSLLVRRGSPQSFVQPNVRPLAAAS